MLLCVPGMGDAPLPTQTRPPVSVYFRGTRTTPNFSILTPATCTYRWHVQCLVYIQLPPVADCRRMAGRFVYVRLAGRLHLIRDLYLMLVQHAAVPILAVALATAAHCPRSHYDTTTTATTAATVYVVVAVTISYRG